MAGKVPGILIMAVFTAYTTIVSRFEEINCPPTHTPDVTWAERWASLRQIWSAIVLIFAVLGGIFFGVVTPTEDGAAITVITIPLLFPVVIAYGYDPVWFAVIFVVNMEVGLITPPVGMNLFIVKAISGEPMINVIRGALPYTLLLIMMLIILILFAQIALWLPDLLLGPAF